MANYDLLATYFDSSTPNNELGLLIQNVEGKMSYTKPQYPEALPKEVVLVRRGGQQPENAAWAWNGNHHLTLVIDFDPDGDPADLVISNTQYYKNGPDIGFLDIVFVENNIKTGATTVLKKKIRRDEVPVSSGAG